MAMRIMLSFLIVFLSLPSCRVKDVDVRNAGLVREDFSLPFHLEEAAEIFELPKSLFEISGLSWAGNSSLYAINDEKGRLYVINASTGEVSDEFEWGKKDDYEGVAAVGKFVYVVESNGNLKKIVHLH